MRETLRRVVAAFCLYAGIALCLTPDHHLLEVEPVNWQQKVGAEQQHSENVKGIMEPYVGHDMLKDVDNDVLREDPEKRKEVASASKKVLDAVASYRPAKKKQAVSA